MDCVSARNPRVSCMRVYCAVVSSVLFWWMTDSSRLLFVCGFGECDVDRTKETRLEEECSESVDGNSGGEGST